MSGLIEQGTCFREVTEDEQEAKRRLVKLLEQDRMLLLTRQPFLASLAMRMDIVPAVDYRLPTAATDSERLFFNPVFMLDLSADERLFVIAHEIWHCAALHFPRRRGRNVDRWNIAIDHEVNGLLRDQGLKLVKGAVLFPEWRHLNAEEVYERLDGYEDRLPDRGEFADIHDPIDETKDAEVNDDESFDIGGQLSPLPVDPDFSPKGSDRVWQEWPRRVHAAAQQTCRDYGTEPGWMRRILKLHGKSEIPWQEILRRFVDRTRGDSYSWTRPNRRFIGQNMFLPGRSGERLTIAVGIDVSGSTAPHIPEFLSELGAILRSYGRYEVRLIACDTRITVDKTLTDEEPLPAAFPLGGGGGTDFYPVFKRLSENPPRALVFLTDGFVEVPQDPPSYPTIWCILKHGSIPAHWGKAVFL